MSEPKLIVEHVFSGTEQDRLTWPPTDPAGFLAWFQEQFEQIPREFMAGASVEIESFTDVVNEEHSAGISIKYTRPETAEEYAERLGERARSHEASDKDTEAKERAMLSYLLMKYGPPQVPDADSDLSRFCAAMRGVESPKG